MQAVADIIRTTLGPRSMLKMLLDATGGENFVTVSPASDAICISFMLNLHADKKERLNLQRSRMLTPMWLLCLI